MRQGVVFQFIWWKIMLGREVIYNYFQNSRLGMRGVHFMAPDSQMRELTQIYCAIFAGLWLWSSIVVTNLRKRGITTNMSCHSITANSTWLIAETFDHFYMTWLMLQSSQEACPLVLNICEIPYVMGWGHNRPLLWYCFISHRVFCGLISHQRNWISNYPHSWHTNCIVPLPC